MQSSEAHTYRQLWHFASDANVATGLTSVWTRRDHGNVLIRQLVGRPTLTVVKGRTNPIQGWISYSYGTKVEAPVEEAILKGTNVRYLTLIVPAAGAAKASVSGLQLTSTGYAVSVAIGGHLERVVVSGSSVTIKKLY